MFGAMLSRVYDVGWGEEEEGKGPQWSEWEDFNQIQSFSEFKLMIIIIGDTL